MSRRLRVIRWGAGVAAAGFAALAIGAAVPPAAVATPEEDCQAVRDRDHRIWLDLIANLPPGAPIPPEPINPCIGPGPETPTTAPPLPGQSGQTGQAGPGLQVGANAPTLMPRYNGTDIVPVPGLPTPPPPAGNPTTRGDNGSATAATTATTDGPAPIPTPGPTAEQTAPPTPSAPTTQPGHTPAPSVPQESTGTEEPGSGGDSHALLLLTGLAGAVAGATRFGRGTSAGGRWPWSGQSATATIHKPFGGEQTFILMADGDAPRTYRFPQPVPEGGRMRSNSDGSVDVLDSNGDVDGRIKAPWAYDATGRPVRTWYEIDGDTLVQHIDPEPGSVYPILADPEYGPEQRAADEELANFIGPLRPEREAERRAAQQRLAANPEPVPFTPESWERAVTTDDLSVPDPGESGDPMLEGLHDIDESRNDSGTGGVAVTPESWERAVTTDELSVPPPGESGDPMLDRLHELGRRPFGAKEKGEGGDDNWEAEFGPLNVIGGIVDYPLQKLDVPAVGSPRPGVMKSAVNGVAGLGKGVPVLNWFVTAAAIASDLSSEEPPSIAESVTTNVGATVVAAAVGGTAMALGAAPVLVAAAGVAAGYGAAWVISKLF